MLFTLPNSSTPAFVQAPQEDFLSTRLSKDAYIRVQKFTHSASSALVHAFSHAICAKSLLFLTLISKFVLPFLPPSLWVDDQFTSLVVELLFFHSGDRDRGLVFRSASSLSITILCSWYVLYPHPRAEHFVLEHIYKKSPDSHFGKSDLLVAR